MKSYDHKKIESKIQKEWEKKKIYQAKNGKGKKFYSLIEFPYPSGDGLHVGHIRSNTAMDIVSRKRRMEGYNVLYPIGWDAFGLPTENYAIKTGKKPTIVTKKNTDTFRKQLKELGFSFDWSREVNTTDPKYYKWTQWIFLQFFKKGLAYKAKSYINWCPKDKIGLANEEAVNGICDRCGSKTEKREKEQWMLAITKYADRLDKDLDLVDYPERVKIQQRNWIGKSEGVIIKFDDIEIFTTRPETIFGATFIAVSGDKNKFTGKYVLNPATKEKIPVWQAEYVMEEVGTGAIMAVPAHDERDFEFAKKYNLPMKKVLEPMFINKVEKDLPFVEREAIVVIVKHWSEDKYLCFKWKKVDWKTFITGGIEKGQTPEQAARIEIEEETGYFNLKLIRALGRYHSKYYHIPKKENRFGHFTGFYFELKNGERKEVSLEEKEKHEIMWSNPKEIEKFIVIQEGQCYFWNILQNIPSIYTGNGVLTNSEKFNGLNSEEAKRKITEFVGGKIVTKFKLRDWVFSRQRYWGEPIPLVNCEKPARLGDSSRSGGCGLVPVEDKDLPVKLPEVKSYKPTDTGESPLASISKWVNTKCPKCRGKAKRETDTMPNWAGSSWYYLRYIDPKNNKVFADIKKLKYWTPVDWYNGGMEHTTLHLLYSRFWHKFLYDLKLVPTVEPYKKRTSHGMILGEGGVKMSKSVGNVVNPDDIVKIYGADTLRIYEMFMGPFEESVAWSTENIIGSRRFIEKVWRISQKILSSSNFSSLRPSPEYRGGTLGKLKIERSSNFISLQKLLHKTIKKVSEDIENMRFNTAISAMMILAAEIEKEQGRTLDLQKGPTLNIEDYKKFLQILAPFAPHITEYIWQKLSAPQGLAFGSLKARPFPAKGPTFKGSIHLSNWPKWDESLIKDQEIKIAVQINGKVRTEIVIQMDEKEEDVKKKALADQTVLKYTAGKNPKKIIYVKNRVINILS